MRLILKLGKPKGLWKSKVHQDGINKIDMECNGFLPRDRGYYQLSRPIGRKLVECCILE